MAHLNNDTRNKSVEENDKFLLGYSCHGFLVYIYKSLSVLQQQRESERTERGTTLPAQNTL